MIDMTSRIIVKNLPKKISEEKFKTHFSQIGDVTDVKLKYSQDGKFRQFGFIGFKTVDEANKAIEFFNNTFIDASKIVVESCKPLNDPTRGRPWSKYSKESSRYQKINAKIDVTKDQPDKKNKKDKKAKKENKLELLVGSLNEDEQFKEFLAANKAIKSKENIWKNDFNINTSDIDENKDNPKKKNVIKKSKNNNSKKHDSEDSSNESQEEEEAIEEEVEDDDENKNNDKNEDTKTTNIKAEVKNQEDDDQDFENGRLFIRNLCYTCKEEDLEKLFEPYGPLVEVNMPIDGFSKKSKGFAYITCMFPEKALKAFNELDGTIYQGRLLHIIPAKSKKEENDTENAKFKDKKQIELKKKSQSAHNWNSLFINQDSVANLMASKYNVEKSQIFDIHSSGKKSSSVAVKLAVGETQIVNDIRKFLVRNGVKLDSFSSENTERSKTTILIKNLPNNTKENDLKELFTKVNVTGSIKRFVMPDYGIAALVEFIERQEARDAFKKLAYRKFKNVPLYLEWAPVDIFDGDLEEKAKLDKEEEDSKIKIPAEKDSELAKKQNEENDDDDDDDDDDDSYEQNATLYVKNLNFDTAEDSLKKLFSKIGKCKVSIARKISPNKESLSMGYGFVKYKKKSDANEAIKQLQNYKLDGHNLELKFSNRTINASQTTARKNKPAKQPNEKSTKILIRNIPFEAKTKEIEELFRVFGELKYARLPKKIDGAHRGFGFVDFVTISDAQRAFEALSHSTHLFGRRLVLEWAQPEQTQDVEILRLKEEQLAGPSSKRLKKSKIIEDLGGEDDFNKMDVTDS